MAALVQLCPAEQVEIDHARLARIRDRLGAERSEAALGGAMEELAYWLYHFEAACKRRDPDRQDRAVEQIAALSGMIGLTSVAKVAAAMPAQGLVGAEPARAAVAARLARVGELSILVAWELQDQTL